MSQHIVYKCDQCKKEIGQKPHISLVVANHMNASGVAIPPSAKQATWGVYQKINGQFLNFHDGKCIGLFFDGLIKKATTKS